MLTTRPPKPLTLMQLQQDTQKRLPDDDVHTSKTCRGCRILINYQSSAFVDLFYIQGDSGGFCSALGNDSMCDSKLKVDMNMGLILNGYQNNITTNITCIVIQRVFMGMAEGGRVPHQSGYTC
jgi:hypothetical protein